MSSVTGLTQISARFYSNLDSAEFYKRVYLPPLMVQAVALPFRRQESQDPVKEALNAGLEYDYTRKVLKPALEKFGKIDILV